MLMHSGERAFAPADDLTLTRDFILSLFDKADIKRLKNGHLRLVIPVTIAELDDLSALGSAAAEMEDDTPGEEEPDREDGGDDEPDLGWSVVASGGDAVRARDGRPLRIRDEFDFDGVSAEGAAQGETAFWRSYERDVA